MRPIRPIRKTTLLLFVYIAVGAGCDDPRNSNFHDLDGVAFKHLGDPCQPDVPPVSQCGYPPQFYCAADGVCASACNTSADCPDGALCVGVSDMNPGECRLPATPRDAGTD